MLKKMGVVLCIVLLGSPLVAHESSGSNPGEDTAGYALLEGLVVGFRVMAQKGTGGHDVVHSLLQTQMAELKKAWEQKQVDAVFFKRYHRILEVLTLAIRMPEEDPEGILDDFTLREMKSFIVDVTGVDAEIPPPEHRGVGAIAGAIAEEILHLHMHLDGMKQKEKLLKKYMDWASPPKKR